MLVSSIKVFNAEHISMHNLKSHTNPYIEMLTTSTDFCENVVVFFQPNHQ